MSDFNVTLPSTTHRPSSLAPQAEVSGVLPRQEVSQELPQSGNMLPLEQSSESEKELPREKLEKAVSHLSDYVQTVSRELQFEIDDDINDVIVTVVDRDTGDVIRQIPQDEVVRMARYLSEQDSGSAVKGLFVNTDGMA